MIKIATHDSATGERGQGFLSWLVTPFAKTQGKTIKEQYEAGCRMFDIRVKQGKNGEWVCAHGIWTAKRCAIDILHEINSFKEQCYVTITYEGRNAPEAFKAFVGLIKDAFPRIIYGGIAIKYGEGSHLFKVKYDYVEPYPKDWPANERAFLPLDGSTWHILIPIPWLWKKVYNDKVEFNDKVYRFVDFL